MDRTLNGFISGLIGSLPMNIINLILYHFKFTQIRFLDWASIILTGDIPRNTFDLIYSIIIQIFWSGSLGIFVAFLVLLTTSKWYLIKGIIYSFFIGFTLRAVVVIFQIQGLDKVSTQTSLFNFMSVSIWGLTTMYMLHRWQWGGEGTANCVKIIKSKIKT